MKPNIKELAAALLGVVFISAFPVAFLYCNNAGEADFSDAVQPLLVFCTLGLAVFLAFLLFTKSPGKSSVISGLFMLAFSNFSFLENGLKMVFPNLHYWHTLPIVFALWLEAAVLICVCLPNDSSRFVSNIMCLVFGVLVIINVITAIPGLAGKVQANRQLAAAREERALQSAARSDLPNVYLLIFDEYANFPQMEEYYGYDNAVLKNFLTENNFTISYDSHNESVWTSTILTNLMNLSYVVDDNTAESEKELLRKQGALFSLMREHGYGVQVVEAGSFMSDDSPASGESASTAKTAAGEDLAYLAYQKTPVGQFYSLNVSTLLEQVERVANYLSSDKIFLEESTFTVGYFCFPHQPFFVDEDGGAVPAFQARNWADNRYYLGQFKYATKLMLRILENILQNDPNSIIILQSDHGVRANELYVKKFPMEVMNNPLNAVYFQGQAIDQIQGMSSVNTLRTVLSQLWDEPYEIQEVPAIT